MKIEFRFFKWTIVLKIRHIEYIEMYTPEMLEWIRSGYGIKDKDKWL
jgi:hypothetical protein